MTIKRAILAAVVAGTLVLTASPAAAADENPPLDAWLTTKAKLAVLTNVGTAGTNINVDTVRGVVTLHGTVASEADEKKAEEAARKIDGVKEVRNLLKVVPPKDAEEVSANDDKVKDAVVAALKKESSLAKSSISVQSVNDGTVLLAGDAENSLAHLKAIATARSVPGVVTVASEIESPDASADAEIWRQIEGESSTRLDTAKRDASESATEKSESTTEKMSEGAKSAGEKVSDTAKSAGDTLVGGAKRAGSATKDAFKNLSGSAKDAAITSSVKAKLLANDETPGTSINVDTENGVVTLFGTVPTAAVKKTAEKEAKQAAGVKRVKNELKVESVKGAKSAKDENE